MKSFLIVLALVAVTYATNVIPDTKVNWSQVKHFMPKIPLPFELDNIIVNHERIVGGWEVANNELPYMAAVVATKETGDYLCGGSLISVRDVLTSAQCLLEASLAQVILGAHRLNIIEVSQQRFFSSEFLIHPGWDPKLLINDIAVIRLQNEAELTNYVGVISMPTFADAAHNFTGEVGILSGWGLTSDANITPSEVLNKLYTDVMSNYICNIAYLGIIQTGHICTNGAGAVGACAGDAGGPLVIEHKQVGIISFALELGCERYWPTVFTRVTYYLDWLEANTDAHIA